MAKLSVKQIQEEAIRLIQTHPGGIRYSALVSEILSAHPETPENTIMGSVWNLDALRPNDVRKPSRGLFQPAQAQAAPQPVKPAKVREEEFYASFGEWLKNELDEVTDVKSFGGAG